MSRSRYRTGLVAGVPIVCALASEPDVFGDVAAAQQGDLTSVARVTEAGGRHQLARGLWGTFVQQIGPFTDAGAPSGKAGTVVNGVIYLVTSPFNGSGTLSGAIAGGLGAVNTSGDVLAAIPYTYTIG
jgi:hypothetical protein